MANNTTTTTYKINIELNEMIFTMGLPAAGKSTTAEMLFGNTHTFIDPDAVKESHPDYDPKNPAALHGWSQEITETMFAEALSNDDDRNWLIDGTGTNAEKMVRRINEAKAAGYTTRLIYVTCSLETSLARNAARERVVPADVIIGKARDIATAHEIVSGYTDSSEIIDNDKAW